MILKPARLVLVITVLLTLTSFSAAQQGRTRSGTGYLDWKAYGGGPDNIRYSRLDQINRHNVRKLKVAWTFDSGDAFPGSEMQCNPIMVNGVLFVTTPKHRILALDAAQGTLRWSFDPTVGKKMTYRTRIRGFNYRENGEHQKLYFAAGHWLYSLAARTGKTFDSYGQTARVELRECLGRDPQS